MLNHRNPSRRRHHVPPTECPLPEVADTPWAVGQHDDDKQYAETDTASFKVFLKRNLRSQSPPADLLSGIRARIEDISKPK